MQGEWWIVGGSAVFADGDIGDFNHEAYVIDHLTQQVVDELDSEGLISSRGIYDVERALEEAGKALVEQEWKNPDDPDDDDEKSLAVAYLVAECGLTEKAVATARGIGDARDYGLEFLGWKRVKGSVVETHHLEAGDLADIARGLGDVLASEEGDDFNFTIEVSATRKLYENVPITVIEGGDVAKLHEYQSF